MSMVYRKKYLLTVLLICCYGFAFSQSKEESEVLGNSQRLHTLVFAQKDSSALEQLFAERLSYGHSSGKVQNRKEAIAGILSNKSNYTDTSQRGFNINMSGDVAIVRYTMRETETNGEGKKSPLNIGIMLVWSKEHGKWKLFGRQAVKLPD